MTAQDGALGLDSRTRAPHHKMHTRISWSWQVHQSRGRALESELPGPEANQASPPRVHAGLDGTRVETEMSDCEQFQVTQGGRKETFNKPVSPERG